MAGDQKEAAKKRAAAFLKDDPDYFKKLAAKRKGKKNPSSTKFKKGSKRAKQLGSKGGKMSALERFPLHYEELESEPKPSRKKQSKKEGKAVMSMDLQEAIRIVQQHNAAGEDCHACKQRISLTRKETLNKHKVQMLKRAATHVMSRHGMGKSEANDFMVRDFAEPEEFKRFNFFSHLRLHGLVFKQTDAAGKVIRGRWGITRNGWSFLRGEKALPSYVMIKSNDIKDRSPTLVKFGDVWRGEDTIETSFEYFDDAGNPVGIRPDYSVTESRQQSLI